MDWDCGVGLAGLCFGVRWYLVPVPAPAPRNVGFTVDLGKSICVYRALWRVVGSQNLGCLRIEESRPRMSKSARCDPGARRDNCQRSEWVGTRVAWELHYAVPAAGSRAPLPSPAQPFTTLPPH